MRNGNLSWHEAADIMREQRDALHSMLVRATDMLEYMAGLCTIMRNVSREEHDADIDAAFALVTEAIKLIEKEATP